MGRELLISSQHIDLLNRYPLVIGHTTYGEFIGSISVPETLVERICNR